jgi:excinuclease ABC subunit C
MDSIPNIGDKRKQVLLKRFGSVEGIRKATIDDLTSITGISEKLARKIKGFL